MRHPYVRDLIARMDIKRYKKKSDGIYIAVSPRSQREKKIYKKSNVEEY